MGQQFRAAASGAKPIDNAGQATVDMLTPDTNVELECCFQIAKVTRPLLCVSRITETGLVDVLCKKDKAMMMTTMMTPGMAKTLLVMASKIIA